MANDVIYGMHAVQSVLESAPEQITTLSLQQGSGARMKKLANFARGQGVKVVSQSKTALDKLAKTSKHQGIVAEIRQVTCLLSEDDLLAQIEEEKQPAFLLILDGVQDPHNLGACLRTAAAAGVQAVVAPKDKSVGLTATVKKVASGGADVCPFVTVTNLTRFLKQIKQLGVWVYGADASPDHAVFDADLKGAVAFVLGAEGSGLRAGTKAECDHIVSIPMPGQMESLNVSVAAGVCLFEVVRQQG